MGVVYDDSKVLRTGTANIFEAGVLQPFLASYGWLGEAIRHIRNRRNTPSCESSHFLVALTDRQSAIALVSRTVVDTVVHKSGGYKNPIICILQKL